MWADNETAVDLLNVQHIVAAVLSVVRDPRLSPITAGVYGDWGSGKSSVIKMVRAELDADPQIVCVYFNGWRFEGYEDAKVALAAAILEALEKEIESEKGKLRQAGEAALSGVRRLLARVDTLRVVKAVGGAVVNAGVAAGGVGVAAMAAGLPVVPLALAVAAGMSLVHQAGKLDGDAVMSVLKEQEKAENEKQREKRQTIRDFRDDFERLVKSLPLRRLVIVVDDLDRCLSENVVDTFEAIRLFLSVQNTAFVIAADENVMRYEVGRRFPAYDELTPDGTTRRRVDVGARYLEKFVQVPVRIPPMSPGDLHGYLNLLFAERHTPELTTFPAFCDRVRQSTAYDQIAFGADEAERLLGAAPSDALREDLALAEQIAPVLALTAHGNPRQTKRFLNALLLRMDMAESRNVQLDRATAAKLLLLEYFRPDVFANLALSAVAQGGIASELVVLETNVRPKAPLDASAAREDGEVSGDHALRASDAATKTTKRTRTEKGADPQPPTRDAASARGATPTAMLPAYTIGLEEDPTTRAWLASEPRIGATDLRPYIYFAAQRALVPLGEDLQLSSTGREVLGDLSTESESFHVRAGKRLPDLLSVEVSAIIGALAKAARRSQDLGAKTSPLYALFRIAQARPDAAGEVLRVVVTIPAKSLPAAAAIQVAELAKHGSARHTAEQVLERWSGQPDNGSLRTSATRRLSDLRLGGVG
jgi:hypothetical protein